MNLLKDKANNYLNCKLKKQEYFLINGNTI